MIAFSIVAVVLLASILSALLLAALDQPEDGK